MLVSLLLSGSALAEIYKWTDPSCRVHYGERPEQGQPADTLEVETTRIGSVEVGKPAGKVVMYATSWCPYCRKARTYFRENRIDYVEYDIEKDRSAKRRYDAMGGRGVPVILVGTKRLNGFDVSAFKSIYP